MKKEERERVMSELAALKGRDVDLSDIPELTDEFWERAEVGKFYKPIKQKLTVRIDSDLIARLKNGGPNYNARLNDILRAALCPPKQERRAGI